MSDYEIIMFILESNKIEGIVQGPSNEEIKEFKRFMCLDVVTIPDLQKFVSIYQPNALLRDTYAMNVRINNYYPPFGGPEIPKLLQQILDAPLSAYKKHIEYEKLHPFTDCNGRSGRMLWAWHMKDISLGFLHKFYYQALENK